jgi:hypothetical protein
LVWEKNKKAQLRPSKIFPCLIRPTATPFQRLPQ